MFFKYTVRFFLIFTILTSIGLAQEEISAPDQSSPTVTEQVPLSDDEIAALVKEKYKGTAMEGFVENNPRVLLVIVRTVRDEKIMNSWKEVWKDKTKYYYFIGFFILSVFINWVWKKRLANTMRPFYQSILPWAFRFTIINGSRVAAFIFIFYKEIAPVWEIFKFTFGY